MLMLPRIQSTHPEHHHSHPCDEPVTDRPRARRRRRAPTKARVSTVSRSSKLKSARGRGVAIPIMLIVMTTARTTNMKNAHLKHQRSHPHNTADNSNNSRTTRKYHQCVASVVNNLPYLLALLLVMMLLLLMALLLMLLQIQSSHPKHRRDDSRNGTNNDPSKNASGIPVLQANCGLRCEQKRASATEMKCMWEGCRNPGYKGHNGYCKYCYTRGKQKMTRKQPTQPLINGNLSSKSGNSNGRRSLLADHLVPIRFMACSARHERGAIGGDRAFLEGGALFQVGPPPPLRMPHPLL